MRYVIMHKNDHRAEAGEKPSMQLIEEMGAFIGDFAKRGKLHGGAGLHNSKSRTRLTFKGGHATIKHGPYRGEHETPAAILQLVVTTKDQAIGWAERYGKILGDGEIELGSVTEPWDLGVMPKPDDAPLHFLLIEKEGTPHDTKTKAELTRLRSEMTKAGVLDFAEHLAPSTSAKRLNFTNHALRVVDGPFVEAKELIGGFAILELDDDDEAIAMCTRYATILGGTLEIDLRTSAAST